MVWRYEGEVCVETLAVHTLANPVAARLPEERDTPAVEVSQNAARYFTELRERQTQLRSATHRFDTTDYQVIYLRGSIGRPAELYKLILSGMKIDPPHSITKAKPVSYDAVAEAKRKPVVVIDDAQDAAAEALLMLKAMTSFDADSAHRITFIISGQPELATTLGFAHFDALRARIRLTHHLSAMSLEETIGYIEHGLAIVKYTGSLFSDNAKMEIFRRTGGIASAVNSLCYRAILLGAIDKKQVIDTADIPQELG